MRNHKWDRTITRILHEVAEEFGLDYRIIWIVFSHYYDYIYRRIISVRYRDLSVQHKRDYAENLSIPYFGRLIHIYGQTRRRYKKIKVQRHKNIRTKKDLYLNSESNGKEKSTSST